MLTDAQQDEFATRGVVRVRAFVPPEVAAVVAAHVWEVLERRGVTRSDRATWPVGRPPKLQAITKADVYAPFVEQIDAFADQVLGAGRWMSLNRPGPLITFPEPGPWQLPHTGWHFDFPARGVTDRPVALRMLGLVEPVAPRCGGTIVVDGTHALTRQMVEAAGGDFGHSVNVRKALAREHEWFGRLFAAGNDRERFFDRSEVNGVRVRVSELTGDAGDVYVMHPWLLHAFAPNAGDDVRSMLTHTVYGDGGLGVADPPAS